ncbi:uncharacterized protein LOC113523596 [Galleria mellonella]|uniref:Uncharacterized protein LOC113523596 n=1 Tax=Galleria mellonella TaxID=7137 RepID=A0A6J1X5W1_GALME|nr:uncharacterized protein LOC113523596 [Galleria mellonella]
MLCPDGELPVKENVTKDEEICRKKNRKHHVEGAGSLELNSYKNPKTWKKSISNFFRNQLRSTKSNDGDVPSGSKENFEDKDVTPEQKWQSLGKIFRRQSFAEHWNKSGNAQGESSSGQNKRIVVRKVLSNYFGKSQKSLSPEENK